MLNEKTGSSILPTMIERVQARYETVVQLNTITTNTPTDTDRHIFKAKHEHDLHRIPAVY